MKKERNEMAEKIELVVFDMAGTTVEDDGEVLAAFMSAVDQHGLEAAQAEVNARMGVSKVEVFRYFVERQYGSDDPENARRTEAVYATFRQVLEGGYVERGVRPIPGTEETFAWLRERGIGIVATTGFYRRVTDLILDGLQWKSGVLDASICADEVPVGRPAPYMIFRAMEATGVRAVHRVLKVGDTPVDLQAGTNAGVRGVIGVLSGSHDAATLGRERHTHLIPSVADLPGLIEAEFE